MKLSRLNKVEIDHCFVLFILSQKYFYHWKNYISSPKVDCFLSVQMKNRAFYSLGQQL